MASEEVKSNSCENTCSFIESSLQHSKFYSRSHQCLFCHKLCHNAQHLLTHYYTHTNEKPYFCPLCDKSFTKSSIAYRHIKIHAKEMQFFFKKSLSIEASPTIHQLAHCEHETLKCAQCDEEFKQKAHLKGHPGTHHTDISLSRNFYSQFPAPESAESFKHPTARKNAPARHHKEICDQSFTQQHKPRKPAGKLTKDQPCCHICDKKFANKGNLKRHLTVHTGSKPYSCDICQQSFSAKGHLQHHVTRIHLKIKGHDCKLCDYRFVSKSELENHMRVHTGEKPFKCRTCSKTFAHSILLRLHIKTHLINAPFSQ